MVPGCGKSNVGAHHIFSRRHMGTRYNLDNGLTLCYGHHIWGFHHEPELFRDLTIKLLGEDKFNQLKVLAYTPQKVDVSLILIGLKELARQQNAYKVL